MARALRVAVVGGGLAGMAAATALQSIGFHVTLIEARKTLGGRAGSFEDPVTGQTLDNCQHVLLGCCTNLLDFYRRVGASERIGFQKAIHFMDGRGRRYDLYGMPGLAAPLHLGLSLLRFEALSIPERLALSRAMLAMMRLGKAGRLRLDDVPFGQWLDEQRQPASLVQKLYDPVLISALNEQTRQVSASYAIQVFQDSLLSHAAGYPVGLPACPLEELYRSVPVEDVRTNTRMAGFAFEDDGHIGAVQLAGGQSVPTDAVVLATNHHNLAKWLPPERLNADPRFASLDRLQSVPILGAHLWFDRPIMQTPHLALIEGPLQWLFAKHDEPNAVHGVISAAREWADRPREQCLTLFEQQIRQTLPEAASARLMRGVVVVEKRATFSVLPGTDKLRPNQGPPHDGPLPNLYLAGDYTRSGWPATMEGAVRSGYLAAEALAAASGQATRFLVPDLEPQWPARFAACVNVAG